MNTNTDVNINKTHEIPGGYKQITKEEFLNNLSKKNNSNDLSEAFKLLIQRMQILNDKRYPTITTGKVQSINSDGKMTVQMIGDNSDVTETVGYTNQTPYLINENDYVKVCKQTAGDKINSWIMAVNTINDKKDAMFFIEKCLDCMNILQEEINDLNQIIFLLTEAYSTSKSGTIIIDSAKINKSKQSLRKIRSVDNEIYKIKQELTQNNQKNNN